MSDAVGKEIYALIERLHPICRSITGDGVRATLDILGEHIPLVRHEVPSGTEVLDWTVPREWNIQDAYVKDLAGNRVVDFKASNLHVMSYSTPVAPQRITLDVLREHLHSLEDQPELIPYRTTYYDEAWGFCLTHNQLASLSDDEYEVAIDSTLADGSLSYGELFIEGETDEEVLISVHVCHPSLANDNLSGVAVAVQLAKQLAKHKLRLSYRFVFIPGTIGAITWLARNREGVERIAHGLTLVCIGNDEPLQYKRTLDGSHDIDRAVEYVLRCQDDLSEVRDFHPYGYDERQYNSPGFRIPVGSLMRGHHGEFPEYHTSADNLSFVRPDRLGHAFDTLLQIVSVLEGNQYYVSLSPFGEPQLGRRGLYQGMGGETTPANISIAMLWVLQLADGNHDLLAVAKRSGVAWDDLCRAVELLIERDLLTEVAEENL
jgi:aminopeptidase-like protein